MSQILKTTNFPLPSQKLMRLSVASADAVKFLDRGKRSFDKVCTAFISAGGEPYEAGKHFLEWGCGCGRMTRHALTLEFQIEGVDINMEAVDWCNANLKPGAFNICDLIPPLPYPDDCFDFIYAGSVITHLSIEMQFKWMHEIRRILKPDGLLLLTFAGTYHFRNYYGRENLKVGALDSHPYLEVGVHDEGLNTFGIAQTVGSLDSLLSGFERKLHIQAHDVLGAQDTVVFKKVLQNHATMVVLLSEEKFVTERTVALAVDGKPVASVEGGIPNQLHIVKILNLPSIERVKALRGFTILDSYELLV